MQPGTKLAHYEILEPIGKGGMGEVYRAKDTKLGRDVAIKVLPDEFAQDEERLRRFQREAKVLASLNHPNIAAIYGLEHSGDTHHLVLELVPGETLADRITRGPIPLDEALGIATKIAEALEEAHEQGVVHRDLKPANVKLTPDDKVKVLDFGLAKALAEDGPEGDVTNSMSPTITRDATRVGVILGTAAYMSPEQAKGKGVDKRSDIFSFGTVLYEMLTGKKAFTGEDVSDVLAAVIRAEPDWSVIPSECDARVHSLLNRCLEKDPKKRLRDIGDVRNEIDAIVAEPVATSEAVKPWTPALSRWLSLLVTALVSGLVVWGIMRPSAPRLVRLVISAAEDAPLALDGNPPNIAISPDGTNVIYRTGTRQLHIRPVDEFEATALVSSGTNPFVSPDGDWIGFFADGAMKKIAVRGGAAINVCSVDGFPRGASWGPDDTIVFASRGSEGLKRVSAFGGEPETLTVVDREGGELNHRWPVVLPNGKAVVFEIYRAGGIDASSLAVLSLETGEVIDLLTGGSFPRYAASGHLVYAGANTLWAVGFDLGRLELTSSPVPVLEGVVTTGANAAYFDVARDGTLVYVPGDLTRADRNLVWVDREGREEAVGSEPRPYVSVALSPDGNRVASEIQDANVDVWVYDLHRQTSTRLTFEAEAEGWPVWSADGTRVAFNVEGDLFWTTADGTGVAERLPATGGGAVWSALPDNGGLLATRRVRSEGSDIELVSPQEARPVIAEPFDQERPSLSPDGRWIAYESNESGRYEIYVRPYPDVATWKRQISNNGGTNAVWARSGRELFYRSDEAMMVVAIETEPAFSASSPRVLFEDPYLRRVRRTYDISTDDRRFLMIKEVAANEGRRELRVILNWTEELKRLVPTNHN